MGSDLMERKGWEEEGGCACTAVKHTYVYV
jgi:hypothetical protein